jgi:hypothetical protein
MRILDELADILDMDFNQGPSSGSTHPMGVQMLEMLGFNKIDMSKIMDEEVDGNTVRLELKETERILFGLPFTPFLLVEIFKQFNPSSKAY